jgi:hypothetical protein
MRDDYSTDGKIGENIMSLRARIERLEEQQKAKRAAIEQRANQQEIYRPAWLRERAAPVEFYRAKWLKDPVPLSPGMNEQDGGGE